MFKRFAAVAFVLLASRASSATVPLATRDLSPSSPVDSNKLFECPSGWKFFCFYDEEGKESHCECYKMVTPEDECPINTQKFCSDYITTECSCSYAKQPNCPPIFDFNCVASTSPSATWTCTCSGKVWGKGGCPSGFNSNCGYKGCACKKVTNFLSDYTPKPKGFMADWSAETEEAEEVSGHELKH